MNLGLNNEGVQRANRCLILQLMLEDGIVSRAELVKKTGLRKATITNIINEFLEIGIVHEAGDIKKASDERKRETLELDIPQARIISLRITSEKYVIYLYNLKKEIIKEMEAPLPDTNDVDSLMDELISKVNDLVALSGEKNILGLCVGLPGPYIRRPQKNIAVVTGFEQLSKIDVQKKMEEAFPFFVITEHDAKLSAFAEWKNIGGELQGIDKILVNIQTVGVGVGAGIILNGKIISGALGIAGEIGHMGININEVYTEYGKGEFEQYASIQAISRYISEKFYEFPDNTLSPNAGYSEIKNAYLKGDRLAESVMHKLAWMVGYGIANIIFMLNPEIVIIGPDYPNSSAFLNEVKKSVRHRTHSDIFEGIPIRFSNL